MTPDRELRPRIVLADDHPSVLIAFRRLLEPSCDVVACVPTGSAAIDAAGTLRPDVLVVDLMMPGLDGRAVCRTVKALMPEIAVVIVTAADDTAVRALALQDGASAFVAKHSASASLERTIQELFAARKAAP
jgi:DNA-binding NarL/FixJ family response regulator